MQFEIFQSITSDHKSRNPQGSLYDFLYFLYLLIQVVNKITGSLCFHSNFCIPLYNDLRMSFRIGIDLIIICNCSYLCKAWFPYTRNYVTNTVTFYDCVCDPVFHTRDCFTQLVKKGAKIKDGAGKKKVFASSSTFFVGVVATKKAEKNCQETSPILQRPIHFRGAATTAAKPVSNSSAVTGSS